MEKQDEGGPIWYGNGRLETSNYHLPSRPGNIVLTEQKKQLKHSVLKELGQSHVCLVEGVVGLPVYCPITHYTGSLKQSQEMCSFYTTWRPSDSSAMTSLQAMISSLVYRWDNPHEDMELHLKFLKARILTTATLPYISKCSKISSDNKLFCNYNNKSKNSL